MAVIAPYGAAKYHFETDLELGQKHLAAGDHVTFLTCSGELLSCDVNIDHRPDQCLNCIFRRRRALRSLTGTFDRGPLVRLEADDRRKLREIPSSFADFEALRGYFFESFDLGMAVFSSVVSHLRDPEPSTSDYRDFIHRMVLSSAAIYLSMKRYLKTGRIDRVYACNGRFATMRAVLRACRESGTDCILHERGSAIERYALFVNELPHNVTEMETRIREAWAEAGETSDRVTIATEFFGKRRQGRIKNWYSFTDHQSFSMLPPGWNPNRHNIVVFPCSEDEFVAIGEEWRNPLYRNQEEGLIRIAADLRGRPGLDLHIRMHPNLKEASFASLDRISELAGENIRITPPESPAGSYAMLFAADVVVTFGSTMGIEATYWDKPSILAGMCFYRNLGSTTNPSDHEELLGLLVDPPPPSDKTGALMYGFYQATFGEPFRFFRPDSLTGGLFRNRRVGPGRVGFTLIRLLNSVPGGVMRRTIGRFFESRSWNRICGVDRTPTDSHGRV